MEIIQTVCNRQNEFLFSFSYLDQAKSSQDIDITTKIIKENADIFPDGLL